MSYFEKYLKYKNKYLELKNIMKGGSNNVKLTSNISKINKLLENIKDLKESSTNDDKLFEEIIKLRYIDKNKDENIQNFTFYTIYNELIQNNIEYLASLYKKKTAKEEHWKKRVIESLKEYSKNINTYIENIKNKQIINKIGEQEKKYTTITIPNSIIPFKFSKNSFQEETPIIDDIYLYNNNLYIFDNTQNEFLNTLTLILNINTNLINLINGDKVILIKKVRGQECKVPLFNDYEKDTNCINVI